jgi:ribosomal protein S18 acetylase RimI-like enzyme
MLKDAHTNKNINNALSLTSLFHLSFKLDLSKKETSMKCSLCMLDAVYKCNICGKPFCAEHITLRPVCPSCIKKASMEFVIRKISSDKERATIRKLVKRFWGEQEQLTFDREFMVAELSAFVAKIQDEIAGFASFTELIDAMLIVALGELPKYQGLGIGRSLIKRIEAEARKQHKKRLLVSTSNDDLPALAFYQSLGFQIFEVEPDIIAEKHGKVLKGIGGLPVRDEIRLQKKLP